jgi:hypothetical protein
MMGSNGQTIITYGGGLPTVVGAGGAVTLFDSSVAFASVSVPSGGSFHLLGLQWFQWSIALGSVAGGGTDVVTGQYSMDKGATWVTFYTSPVPITDGVAPLLDPPFRDEVYVGMYKDIRFQLTATTEVPTISQIQLALNPHKATSKQVTAATLGGNP